MGPTLNTVGVSQMTLAQAPIALQVAARSASGSLQEAKLTASDGVADDLFGFSVALSGSTAVVGANSENSGAGAAYVFARSGTTWTQQAKLTASDAAANDNFGNSVAISGSTAVVGAPSKNSSTGMTYVFVRSGTAWSEQAKLTASDGAADDNFGFSVATSGSAAVVGAPGKNLGAGAAYMFVRSGTAWSQQAKITAADRAANDNFGNSVAISSSTAVVAAPGKNSGAGAAYVFVRSGTAWSQQAKLTASDGASFDNFGNSVAISGATAVVGASVNVAAYVFVRSGTTWTQQAELTASDGAPNDLFGLSVAISGSTTVVGAPGKNSNTGAAYAYVLP
jgi:FG-GAP repeat protein